MCGRYTVKRRDRIAAFGKDILHVEWQTLAERFNVAPTQRMPIARVGDDGKPEASELPWKVPPNARREGIAVKPMWARSVQQRRCLVPADGFYEWKKITEKIKEPHHFQLKDGEPFFFAGIFDREFVIITTTPNEVVSPIHDRMPVILNAETALAWLRPGEVSASDIESICQPYPASRMESWPVHKLVGNARNDAPECAMPWKPEPDAGLLPGLDLNSA